jgi:ATP-dependent RNA helicase RhlE
LCGPRLCAAPLRAARYKGPIIFTHRPSHPDTTPSPDSVTTGFLAFELAPPLQRAIAAAGFREPRPIQVQTIPAALAGRDILGLSKTGSGKTAAFALPILARLVARPGAGPRALVIAPTRELAAQIEQHVRVLAAFTRIKTVTVFGGVSEKAQIAALRERPDIIVACPGRLLDLWGRDAVDLRHIETLVIDEADHMFDLGFLPDVRRIIAALPERRQNLLFSATMPPAIRTLAERLLRKPHVVELTDSQPAASIEHVLCPMAEGQKVDALRGLLRRAEFESAIVFLRTKRRAKNLADKLGRLGHRAIALQGNMSQPQRQRAMHGFTTRRFEILVATDIAARGIDVAGVSYVVNFDVPWPPEGYTHRIGRTGRAECSGQAFTFVTPADAQAIRAIERMLGSPIPRVQLALSGDSPAGGARLDARHANGVDTKRTHTHHGAGHSQASTASRSHESAASRSHGTAASRSHGTAASRSHGTGGMRTHKHGAKRAHHDNVQRTHHAGPKRKHDHRPGSPTWHAPSAHATRRRSHADADASRGRAPTSSAHGPRHSRSTGPQHSSGRHPTHGGQRARVDHGNPTRR